MKVFRQFFREVRVINISLSMFVTSKKDVPRRMMTICQCLLVFRQDNVIATHHLTTYHPFPSSVPYVHLYQRLRSVSWENFCRQGNNAPFMRSKFALQPTFFVSISLHHAFEHPLHVHPWRYTSNIVSMLAFRVPINVIHGDIVPPPLIMLRFQFVGSKMLIWNGRTFVSTT